jgi:uncharacterized membrane protein
MATFAPTFNVEVPLTPLSEAVTAVEPEATPVASPLEFTLASVGVATVQPAVALTSAVDPSLYVAVALNCWVAPTQTLALAGDTEMDVRTFVCTVSVEVPLIPLSEAVTVVEPEATPVASPLEFTLAVA